MQLLSPSVAPSRVVILFAAHNDHGYETRMRLGRHLAEHGIASLILENPFYGRRRPLDGRKRPVTTVAELLVMGRAAVTEGRALVAALRAQGRGRGRGFRVQHGRDHRRPGQFALDPARWQRSRWRRPTPPPPHTPKAC